MLAVLAVAAFAVSGLPGQTDRVEEIASGGPPTTPPVSGPVSSQPVEGVISGVLPNGDRYQVESASLNSTVRGISAGIILDGALVGLDDGEAGAPTVGVATFQPFAGVQPSVDDEAGVVVAVSGDWALRLSIHDSVRQALGDDAATQVASWIAPSDTAHESGLPSFRLSGPLRWATDQEIPLQMEVSYPGFVVHRGCGSMAKACTDDGSLQAIALETVVSPAPAWPGGSVQITNE